MHSLSPQRACFRQKDGIEGYLISGMHLRKLAIDLTLGQAISYVEKFSGLAPQALASFFRGASFSIRSHPKEGAGRKLVRKIHFEKEHKKGVFFPKRHPKGGLKIACLCSILYM